MPGSPGARQQEHEPRTVGAQGGDDRFSSCQEGFSHGAKLIGIDRSPSSGGHHVGHERVEICPERSGLVPPALGLPAMTSDVPEVIVSLLRRFTGRTPFLPANVAHGHAKLPRMQNVDWEKRSEAMPDNAPPKWIFRNVTAIREDTDRILAILERERGSARSTAPPFPSEPESAR